MEPSAVSRRDFVAAATGVATSAWLASHAGIGESLAYAAEASPQDKYTALTAAQVKELDAITSTLVPSDGTPGAKEARVVRFIDRSLSTWAKDQKAGIEGAMAALAKYTGEQRPGAASFAALSAADRVTVMTGFEKDHGNEFGGLLFPTLAGMFTNPSYGGNANKVGWKLMGFTDQFSWKAPFGYYDRV